VVKDVLKVVRQHIQVGNAVGPTLPVVCPGCSREGNFAGQGPDILLQVLDSRGVNASPVWVGSRFCPNPSCTTHVFVVYQNQGGLLNKVVHSYPAGRIDFDVAGVPTKVWKAFDEALTCTANECYVGAGMLIRKTLEAVCEDRAAQGKDLKARVTDLKTKLTLPNELFEAMDHLRLLGNDAAHIEAKSYDEVGPDEVLAGIDLTKEIIKATYQYKGLLSRLQALKKPPA
jgi:Domain of unknown function (DUF4145)